LCELINETKWIFSTICRNDELEIESILLARRTKPIRNIMMKSVKIIKLAVKLVTAGVMLYEMKTRVEGIKTQMSCKKKWSKC
jgi:hypothetical protein